MRRRYIVTYDVSDPKRVKKAFKVLRGWGDHLQFSVFECLLNEMERIRLTDEIRAVVNEREDQVLFFDLGLAESETEPTVHVLGRAYRPKQILPVIV